MARQRTFSSRDTLNANLRFNGRGVERAYAPGRTEAISVSVRSIDTIMSWSAHVACPTWCTQFRRMGGLNGRRDWASNIGPSGEEYRITLRAMLLPTSWASSWADAYCALATANLTRTTDPLCAR